ncbi:MAG: fibronectin type III-like domain-contianing protein [Candidatus Thorarchaeota archaeon]|jgi:beta-glucosidase
MKIEPGEVKTANVKIKASDLAFYNVDEHRWKIEPGEFKLLSGKSSRDISQEAELQFT